MLDVRPCPLAEAVRLGRPIFRDEHLAFLEHEASTEILLEVLVYDVLVDKILMERRLEHGDLYPRYFSPPDAGYGTSQGEARRYSK